MTLNEFWKKAQGKGILNHYPALKALFSKELPLNVEEQYDLIDLIGNFIWRYAKAKRFEELSEFAQLLREKHPALFADMDLFFYDALIDYYAYQDKKSEIKQVAKDVVSSFFKEPDIAKSCFDKLLYYGYIEEVEQIVESSYDQLYADELYQPVGENFAFKKQEILLGKLYLQYQETGELDWQRYKEELEDYEPIETSTPEVFMSLNQDMKETDTNVIQSTFLSYLKDEDPIGFYYLRNHFMRYAQHYKLSFPLSGTAWVSFSRFLLDRGWIYENIFDVKEKDFKPFLLENGASDLTYRYEAALILWSWSYIYDFLLDLDLIDEKLYNRTQNLIQRFKKRLMQETQYSMWRFSFVHRWQRAESVSEEEEQTEKEAFEAAYQASNPKLDQLDGFFAFESEPISIPSSSMPTIETVEREGPKIGRNDKVTVKYTDGTVKKGIKYKKVKRDVEDGFCKVVRVKK